MTTPVETIDIINTVSHSAGLAPSVQMLLVIVGLILFAAAPVAMFLRYLRGNHKADIKDGAEGNLYAHLSDQVTTLSASLSAMQKEYNAMFKKNSLMEARVAQLEGYEKLVDKLQERLNEKDMLLSTREGQINVLFADLRSRDNKIIELQDRVHNLELKLVRESVNEN